MTTNAIKNLPITLKNVETAEEVFGPDIGSLKGMVTRNLPMLVMSIYIRVPKELVNNHQCFTLCIDTIHINGLVFFI